MVGLGTRQVEHVSQNWKEMSVLHRGKSTILQTFPAEDVVRWKERLSTVPPEGMQSGICDI